MISQCVPADDQKRFDQHGTWLNRHRTWGTYLSLALSLTGINRCLLISYYLLLIRFYWYYLIIILSILFNEMLMKLTYSVCCQL